MNSTFNDWFGVFALAFAATLGCAAGTTLILILYSMGGPDTIVTYDKGLQREVFNECIQILPKGPEATHYNDWDEAIEECRWHSRDIAEHIEYLE